MLNARDEFPPLDFAKLNPRSRVMPFACFVMLLPAPSVIFPKRLL
jgi:hypothetical protein